jgi:hypothetical protein
MSKIDEHREYIGTVIDNLDPNCAGRCKVKVAEVMAGVDENFIPWATPGMGGTFAGDGLGSLSIPKKGTVVRVKFKNGDLKAPEYFGVQKVDKNLVNEIQSDYVGSQVLCFDHENDMSIRFQPNHGIIVYLGGSYLQINPDGMITINHSGNTSIIQLEGKDISITSTGEINASSTTNINIESKVINLKGDTTTIKGDRGVESGECAVNGHALMNYLETIAKIIDAKYCVTPNVCAGQLEALKPKILNQSIKYVS